MSRQRFSIGPLVGAAGALLLGVSLFLDWYDEFTAFTVFEVLDLVLLGLALVSLLSLAGQLGLRLPVGAPPALPLGIVALAVVVSQLINHPPAAVGREEEIGAWLALGGCALLVGGALLGARISLSVNVQRRGPAPSAPEQPTPGGPTAQPATDPEAPTVSRPPNQEPRG